MKGLLSSDFIQSSLIYLEVCMSDIGPKQQWLDEHVQFLTLIVIWGSSS